METLLIHFRTELYIDDMHRAARWLLLPKQLSGSGLGLFTEI